MQNKLQNKTKKANHQFSIKKTAKKKAGKTHNTKIKCIKRIKSLKHQQPTALRGKMQTK